MKLLLCLCALLSIKLVSGFSCWVCENVISIGECKRRGYMKLCPTSETMCQTELRHGGWGPEPLIEKSCKIPTACGSNYVQNAHSAWSYGGEQIQCNGKPPSSVCRCCCTTDMCNFNVTSCKPGTGKCDKLSAPRNGYMSCDYGFSPSSTCKFKCRRGFALIGSPSTQCSNFGDWSSPRPRCAPITCPPAMLTPEFGWKRCTNGIRLGSVCRFGCEEGYRLHGGERLQCIEHMNGGTIGLWSRTQPVCKPLQCTKLRLNHGKYVCSNDNYVGSSCSLKCNTAEGYQRYPASFTQKTCQRNEKWDAIACCGLPCPGYAIMDFILVLDSSSSVGKENFAKMKKFVRGFLDDFVVRDDSSRFSIIRYNGEVDTDTQILLNDYPDSTQKVLEAFDKIPYDGRTKTGKALNYTADVLLKVGNRPLARDVVLLITDGASQDEVIYSSKRVRDKALLYVLPVLPPTGRLDMDEVYHMAGNRDNVLTDALEKGFDALDEDFSKKITKILCGNPCLNPLHHHELDDDH